MRICISGASGFIGSSLLTKIENRGENALALTRNPLKWKQGSNAVYWFEHYLASPSMNLVDEIKGTDVVVHLAARVHVLDEKLADPLPEFRKVNVDGTLNFARQAAEAGVKRFIFISSIGVHGNQNTRPFTVHDAPNPVEPYAVSKLEAEQELRQLADATGMELVAIRPPLVYGPNAPGNFGRLVRLVHKGLPLPLGLVRNKRSLVALDNLVDLILTCTQHPAAAGQTFLVSDGEDLSTPELIHKLASAMGRPARLLPVPLALLRLGGTITGKKAEVDRLIGSLQVDIGHTCDTLSWQPPVSVHDAIVEIGRSWED